MIENPVESSRGMAPPPIGDLDLDTLQSELVVRAHTEIKLWPSTLRGVILYLLAAGAAIVVGILPALWINVWRHEASAQPAPSEPAGIGAPHVEPIEAAASPAPATAAPASTGPASTDIAAATVASTPPRAKAKPARAKPPRVKPAPRPPKKPSKSQPTCDIYLHPHGCPK